CAFHGVYERAIAGADVEDRRTWLPVGGQVPRHVTPDGVAPGVGCKSRREVASGFRWRHAPTVARHPHTMASIRSSATLAHSAVCGSTVIRLTTRPSTRFSSTQARW